MMKENMFLSFIFSCIKSLKTYLSDAQGAHFRNQHKMFCNINLHTVLSRNSLYWQCCVAHLGKQYYYFKIPITLFIYCE